MKRVTLRYTGVKIVSLMLGIVISACLGSIPGNRLVWAASGQSEEPVGEVRQTQGTVAVIRGGEQDPKALSDSDSVYVQDAILTRANSKLWCNLDKTAAGQNERPRIVWTHIARFHKQASDALKVEREMDGDHP